MRLSAVLPSLLLFTSPTLHAAPADGPFGIAKGANPATLGCTLADPSQGLWHCAHPPRPQPGFTDYAVVSSWSAGVCHVLAATNAIPGDPMGDVTRSRVEQEALQLAKQYGPWGTHADSLASGGPPPEPGPWMAALKHGQQTFSYTWFGSSMPDDVVMIVLKATALDAGTGKVTVEFFLANSACAAEHDTKSPI